MGVHRASGRTGSQPSGRDACDVPSIPRQAERQVRRASPCGRRPEPAGLLISSNGLSDPANWFACDEPCTPRRRAPRPAMLFSRLRLGQQGVAAALRIPAATVSHASAVALHGLPLLTTPQLPCVTLPPESPTSETALHLHRQRLPTWQLDHSSGVSITSVARSCIDLARESGLDDSGLVTATPPCIEVCAPSLNLPRSTRHYAGGLAWAADDGWSNSWTAAVSPRLRRSAVWR